MRPSRAPLLILDFDDTLVDKDSSEWVAKELGAAPLFDHLRWVQGMPWHQAMNAVLRSVHSQGTTISHIRHALSCLPLPSATVAALKAAYSLGCELHMLSDANTFFIESVLSLHGLDSLFTHIYSNPAWIDAQGCLCYSDFHPPELPPHTCPLCPPNMCKGSILETIQSAASFYGPAARKIIYAGDGVGDLCPSLLLSERDCVLPRRGYALSSLLDEHLVKATVHPWVSLADAVVESLRDYADWIDCPADLGLDDDGLHLTSSGAISAPVYGAANQGDDFHRKGSTAASAAAAAVRDLGTRLRQEAIPSLESGLVVSWHRRHRFSKPLCTGQILHRNFMVTTHTRTLPFWKSTKRSWPWYIQASAASQAWSTPTLLAGLALRSHHISGAYARWC